MSDFAGWKYYLGMNGLPIGIMRTFSDGHAESKILTDPEVTDWLEAGNTPLPADGAL